MKYFGTDGIRQKAEKFTPEFLAKIVHGLIKYKGENIKVLLAGDTRESTEWIISDLENILETFGIEYNNAGVLPTPAIYYCFYEMGFDFAIDVTASHNPYTDNGIKIFERGNTHAKKLTEKGREIVEKTLNSDFFLSLTPKTIRENLHEEALKVYEKHLLDYTGETSFNNLHIGMDCANGATSVINKTIFVKLGAKVELINSNEKYNTEINQNCGSTHLKSLSKLVVDNSLDFGVAFDGDGDRCLLVDKSGKTVDGDEIIAILTNYLNLNSVAVTVMANQGIMNWAKENDIHLEITDVGDQNVVKSMIEKSIELGGEQSGHIILPNESSGDGMLTALMITKIITETRKPLHELASVIKKSPQVLVNLEASPEQKEALKSESAKNLLKSYEEKLKDISGRLLVRPSGTENLIRITIWGDNENIISSLAENLREELTKIL